MKGKIVAFGISLICTSAVLAEPTTPARGSDLRRDLLASVRVMAAYDLGAPVEFVVDSLEADEDRAFAMLSIQRPGGAAIDLSQSPMVSRDGIPPDLIDGAVMVAFLQQIGGHWYIDEYSIGATDVWWAGGEFCADYASMLPKQACP